jgi:hypothetical protein
LRRIESRQVDHARSIFVSSSSQFHIVDQFQEVLGIAWASPEGHLSSICSQFASGTAQRTAIAVKQRHGVGLTAPILRVLKPECRPLLRKRSIHFAERKEDSDNVSHVRRSA